jgi:hypothetical protein
VVGCGAQKWPAAQGAFQKIQEVAFEWLSLQ